MSDRWDEPSDALRRMAEAPEPAIKPMTEAEKRSVVRAGSIAAHRAAGHSGPIEKCDPCTRPLPAQPSYESPLEGAE